MHRRFLALGECMVEMSRREDGLYRRGFAGDTFNTAWYARRLLPDSWQVAYGTAIGTDALSDEMAAFMTEAGIDISAVARHQTRTVGLYMIALDRGERSFTYWRSRAAARTLADDPARLAGTLSGADVVYVSGITLAILPPGGRATLCAALAEARSRGACIVFDTNIRPALWDDAPQMRAGLSAGAAVADIVLASFDEETAHFGDAAPADTLARYRAAGARVVAVKNGGDALHLWSAAEGGLVLAPEPVTPVDTTAAGDSFAAAFLAAFCDGAGLAAAGRAGMALAARVIAAPGALVREAVADMGAPAPPRDQW